MKTKGFYEKFTKKEGTYNLRIPKIFSLTNNPDETIITIQKMFYYGTCKDISGIHFDHSNCKEIEISASTIMDIVLMEIIEARKRFRWNLNLSGYLPKDEECKIFLEVSGIKSMWDLMKSRIAI